MGEDQMNVLSYRILLRQEPEGGYTVIVPSLPGCVTYGDTVEEAIEMAKEAIELYIESLKEHGEEIPTEERTLEYTLTVEAYA
jgi:antitoxin HicB